MEGSSKEETLRNFMEEMFDIEEMIKIGFFKKGESYQEHADRVCKFFGFNTVYEYGALEGRVHITFADKNDPTGLSLDPERQESFVTEFESIFK